MTRRGNYTAIFLLFLVASPLGWAASSNRRRNTGSNEEQQESSSEQFGQQQRRNQDSDQQQGGNPKAKPFKAGTEYTFTYNGQIAHGLDQDPSASGNPPQQKAATRFQAQAKIQFTSDRHAQLRLEKIRIGESPAEWWKGWGDHWCIWT